MLRRILNLAPEGAVAAPAAPVAPAPAAPTPPAAKPVEGDPFASLEDVMGGPDDSQAKPIAAPAAPAATPKQPDKPTAPVAPEGPKSLEDLIKDQKTFSKLPKDFRSFAERTNQENKTLAQKLADQERKLAEYEARGKDTSKITERIAQLEKELSERDGTIRALRQEASPEFKEKWDKPFEKAKQFANQTISQLDVYETGADGQVRTRPGKWEDFQALYSLPLNKASKAAREMFKDEAQTVINHLNEVQRLDYQRSEALKEERENFKQREAKDVADRTAAEESNARRWREANKAMEESNPLFQPTDTKEAETIKKGLQIWDSASDPKSGMTPDAQAIAGAALRYRAASQPILVARLAKADARIAELEAKLKEKVQGDPSETDLGNPGGGAPSATPDDEFDLSRGGAFDKAMEG